MSVSFGTFAFWYGEMGRASAKRNRDEKEILKRKDPPLGKQKDVLQDETIITDVRLLSIIRSQLYLHSSKYQNVHMKCRYADFNTKIMVTLSGENSGYCRNFGGVHEDANAYMLILRGRNGQMVSVVRCLCSSPTLRRENGQGYHLCSHWQDKMQLRKNWEAELFPERR